MTRRVIKQYFTSSASSLVTGDSKRISFKKTIQRYFLRQKIGIQRYKEMKTQNTKTKFLRPVSGLLSEHVPWLLLTAIRKDFQLKRTAGRRFETNL